MSLVDVLISGYTYPTGDISKWSLRKLQREIRKLTSHLDEIDAALFVDPQPAISTYGGVVTTMSTILQSQKDSTSKSRRSEPIAYSPTLSQLSELKVRPTDEINTMTRCDILQELINITSALLFSELPNQT